MDIEKGLLNGDKRSCARLITMLENNDACAIDILKRQYKNSGKAYVVGITGPPGSGKSTLTDKLTRELRKQDKKVGVIAIDPTSPFTGGAILGDRIRMNDHALDNDVFIRSMGTRGSLGGMAKSTWSAVKVLDIFGCDYIFIETVGVGQSEIDIVKTADTVLMVMLPNLGDDIQAIKAGSMEIADIFAINKSDLDGADKAKAEIEMNLNLNDSKEYRPAVINISALKNENIDILLEEIFNHRKYLEDNNKLENKRVENNRLEILKMVEDDLMALILKKSVKEDLIERLAREVTTRTTDPYTAKDKIIDLMRD